MCCNPSNIIIIIIIFFFLRYDINSNLNSHTHIFEDPEDWTHTLIEEWSILGRGITTGPNTQVAKFDMSKQDQL